MSPELISSWPEFVVDAHPQGRTRPIGDVSDQSQMLTLLALMNDLQIEIVSINPMRR